MNQIEALREELGNLSGKLNEARTTLTDAEKREPEAEAAITDAAAAAYLHAGSGGAEEEARARLAAVRAEIDRLKRVLHVGQGRMGELLAALDQAERAEAKAAVDAADREIDALFGEMLAKHLEADDLSERVVDLMEKMRPTCERLGLPAPYPWPRFRQMQEAAQKRRGSKLVRL